MMERETNGACVIACDLIDHLISFLDVLPALRIFIAIRL